MNKTNGTSWALQSERLLRGCLRMEERVNQLPTTAQAFPPEPHFKTLGLIGCTVLILYPPRLVPPHLGTFQKCLYCDQALGFLHKPQYDRNLLWQVSVLFLGYAPSSSPCHVLYPWLKSYIYGWEGDCIQIMQFPARVILSLIGLTLRRTSLPFVR